MSIAVLAALHSHDPNYEHAVIRCHALVQSLKPAIDVLLAQDADQLPMLKGLLAELNHQVKVTLGKQAAEEAETDKWLSDWRKANDGNASDE